MSRIDGAGSVEGGECLADSAARDAVPLDEHRFAREGLTMPELSMLDLSTQIVGDSPVRIRRWGISATRCVLWRCTGEVHRVQYGVELRERRLKPVVAWIHRAGPPRFLSFVRLARILLITP